LKQKLPQIHLVGVGAETLLHLSGTGTDTGTDTDMGMDQFLVIPPELLDYEQAINNHLQLCRGLVSLGKDHYWVGLLHAVRSVPIAPAPAAPMAIIRASALSLETVSTLYKFLKETVERSFEWIDLWGLSMVIGTPRTVQYYAYFLNSVGLYDGAYTNIHQDFLPLVNTPLAQLKEHLGHYSNLVYVLQSWHQDSTAEPLVCVVDGITGIHSDQYRSFFQFLGYNCSIVSIEENPTDYLEIVEEIAPKELVIITASPISDPLPPAKICPWPQPLSLADWWIQEQTTTRG
jgi:hypothetical protein